MTDPQSLIKETPMTCMCGHPEREHSACTGECYLCGCKHYAPAKIGPGESGGLARAYRSLLTFLKKITGTDSETTMGKGTRG